MTTGTQKWESVKIAWKALFFEVTLARPNKAIYLNLSAPCNSGGRPASNGYRRILHDAHGTQKVRYRPHPVCPAQDTPNIRAKVE